MISVIPIIIGFWCTTIPDAQQTATRNLEASTVHISDTQQSDAVALLRCCNRPASRLKQTSVRRRHDAEQGADNSPACMIPQSCAQDMPGLRTWLARTLTAGVSSRIFQKTNPLHTTTDGSTSPVHGCTAAIAAGEGTEPWKGMCGTNPIVCMLGKPCFLDSKDYRMGFPNCQ